MRRSRFHSGAVALTLAACLAAATTASAGTHQREGRSTGHETAAGFLSDLGSFCAGLWEAVVGIAHPEPAAPNWPAVPEFGTGDEGSSLDPHG